MLNGKQLTHINVDETNDGSAVNVSYVKSKYDQLTEYRKVALFENSSEVSVSGETILDVPLLGVIYVETIVRPNGVNLNLYVSWTLYNCSSY